MQTNATPEETTVISVSKLDKMFGKTKALDGLDLQVNSGEVHGFLGPNGSGKSTTIRVLLGLIGTDGGRVSVLGQDPWRDAVSLHQRLVYVPDEVNLWPNFTGGEAIDLLGRLRGNLNYDRRDELIERFQFDPTKKFRTYSKGNRQKAAVIAALAAEVDLYIMDEPTGGLDPLMESIFQEYIMALKQEGKTVLFSSHVLAEVEKLCDRVTIIREGKTVESGTLDELRYLTRLSVKVATTKPITGLEALSGLHEIDVAGTQATFEVEPLQLDDVLAHLVKFGVKNLISTPPTLGDLFMRHYDEAASDSTADSGTEQ